MTQKLADLAHVYDSKRSGYELRADATWALHKVLAPTTSDALRETLLSKLPPLPSPPQENVKENIGTAVKAGVSIFILLLCMIGLIEVDPFDVFSKLPNQELRIAVSVIVFICSFTSVLNMWAIQWRF